MNCLKRAYLYVTRKKGKSILLFLILLVTATFVLSGLCIGDATRQAQMNLRKNLGGAFDMTINYSEDNPYYRQEGVFTESPFGTHEESAEQICERKGFTDEYWKWVKESGDNEIGHLMRDFLSEVKGYCLIHNPSGYAGYIVTNMKALTKHQKNFLYNYFMDMGDRFKAEQFVE